MKKKKKLNIVLVRPRVEARHGRATQKTEDPNSKYTLLIQRN